MGKKSILGQAQSSHTEQHDFLSVPQTLVQELKQEEAPSLLPAEPNGHAITATILESSGIGYNSLAVSPKDLTIFSSDLSLKIIEVLAKEPQCAMDIARALGEHEQKIYYHIRKLEKAGLIRIIAREQRLSMTAKIFQLVAPAIHITLNRADFHVPKERPKADQRVLEFLHPFVENGKLNALIVMGDPNSHGRFDASAKEGPHAIDVGFFLGQLVENLSFPHYKLDTQVNEDDMKRNLILIGNNETNTVIEKMNDRLPLYFDVSQDFSIVSRKDKKRYTDPRHGLIIKQTNPFNENAKILILGGRTRGTLAAIIAVTRQIADILKKAEENNDINIIVKGLDIDADGLLDSIKIED